jgi:hypothetical protein
MKFKNKILRLSLRYTKEKGWYKTYTERIKKLYGNINEEKLINSCQYQSPLLIMLNTHMVNQDVYSNDFITYAANVNEEKTMQLFDKFLTENNIKDVYYNNLNTKFIKRNFTKKETIEEIEKIKEPFEILKKLYPPTGYIMYAFHWEETKQGHSFWVTKCSEWVNYFLRNFNE